MSFRSHSRSTDSVDEQRYKQEVAVTEELPEDVLLVTGIPLEWHLFKSLNDSEKQEELSKLLTELDDMKASMVTMISQAKRAAEEKTSASKGPDADTVKDSSVWWTWNRWPDQVA